MCSMTLFQKSYILSKFWVREKSLNVGGRIKRVAQRQEGGKKLFSILHYIYFQEIKKILYVLHVRVNLEIRFSPVDYFVNLRIQSEYGKTGPQKLRIRTLFTQCQPCQSTFPTFIQHPTIAGDICQLFKLSYLAKSPHKKKKKKKQ